MEAAMGVAGSATALAAATGDPVENVVVANCTLVAGQFDKFIQFLLACLSLGVLVVKRYREHPPRPLTIWALDSSKQCFGAGVAHLTNLLISIFLAGLGESDECAIYFLNFFLDTTIGVFISYLLLQVLQRTALACSASSSSSCSSSTDAPSHPSSSSSSSSSSSPSCCAVLARTGYYGDALHPSLLIWLTQLLSWLVIIFITKFVIFGFIYVAWNPLNALALGLFAPFERHRKVELILVMIVGPTILNAVQFYIQDNFLMDEQRLGERLPLMKLSHPSSPSSCSSSSNPCSSSCSSRKDVHHFHNHHHHPPSKPSSSSSSSSGIAVQQRHRRPSTPGTLSSDDSLGLEGLEGGRDGGGGGVGGGSETSVTPALLPALAPVQQKRVRAD
ncbi:Hypothetical protein NocV09_05100210 [Nannochloropsis oceanica]